MKVLIGLGLIVTQPIWYGWVLHVLWGWFVTPTFAVPLLTIPQALGLAVILRMFTYTAGGAESDQGRDVWLRPLVVGYVYPAVALLFGWIYSWFL